MAGGAVPTWDDLEFSIGTRAGREIELTVLREGKTISSRVRPNAEGKYEIGRIGVLPDVNPVVRSTEADYPAEHAGIKAGDVVVAVNGELVAFAQDLRDAIVEVWRSRARADHPPRGRSSWFA